MFIKNKLFRLIIYVMISLIILFSGISCIATLHKAITQPYLVSDGIRFNFMGYYMMAAMNGLVCIIFILTFVLLLFKKKNK